MSAKSRQNSKLTKLIIVIELFFVSYLLYTLTESVYRSYQIDQVIAQFEKENNELETENRRKIEDFEYYSSENYYEKIAKQNLGMVNPGEEVIVIPKSDFAGSDDLVIDNYDSNLEEIGNAEKWYIFFFDTKG